MVAVIVANSIVATFLECCASDVSAFLPIHLQNPNEPSVLKTVCHCPALFLEHIKIFQSELFGSISSSLCSLLKEENKLP